MISYNFVVSWYPTLSFSPGDELDFLREAQAFKAGIAVSNNMKFQNVWLARQAFVAHEGRHQQ